MSSTPTLESEFAEVERHIAQRDRIAPGVSSVDVAWHLDHLLKVVSGIHDSLEYSNPAEYDGSFSIMRAIFFTAGRFPRGVVEAPESVRPPEKISTDDIYAQLKEARSNVSNFAAFDENQFFVHSEFGVLNRDQSLRLVEIHTRHHLRIIRDIVGASGEGE